MARMVLIWGKPLRYPHGPEGKEYKTGDEFDALSERDAGHFVKIGAAKLIEDKKKAEPAIKAEPVTPAPEPPAEADDARKYRTRAMRAKE